VNKFIIASAIALASLAATSLPSHAASVEVMTDGGNNDGNYDVTTSTPSGINTGITATVSPRR
jgi:hypothetical protein